MSGYSRFPNGEDKSPCPYQHRDTNPPPLPPQPQPINISIQQHQAAPYAQPPLVPAYAQPNPYAAPPQQPPVTVPVQQVQQGAPWYPAHQPVGFEHVFQSIRDRFSHQSSENEKCSDRTKATLISIVFLCFIAVVIACS